MVNFFERKGEVPQWQLLVDYVRNLPDGYVASRAELAEVVDCKPSAISSVVFEANRRIYDQGIRITAVPNVGYRMATPGEMLHEATVTRGRKFVSQAKRGAEASSSARNAPEASLDEREKAEKALLHWTDMRRIARKGARTLRGVRPELPVVRRSGEL